MFHIQLCFRVFSPLFTGHFTIIRCHKISYLQRLRRWWTWVWWFVGAAVGVVKTGGQDGTFPVSFGCCCSNPAGLFMWECRLKWPNLLIIFFLRKDKPIISWFLFYYWSIIVLQCVNFWWTTKGISFRYTYIPSSWTSLPPLASSYPSRSSQSPGPSSLC